MRCRLITLCGCMQELEMDGQPEQIVLPILTANSNFTYGRRYFQYIGLAPDADVANYREVVLQKFETTNEIDQLKELNKILSKYTKEMKYAK